VSAAEPSVIACEIRARSRWLPGAAATVTWEPGMGGQPDSYVLEVSDGEHTRAAVRLNTDAAMELALAPGLSDLARERERQTYDEMQRGLTRPQE